MNYGIFVDHVTKTIPNHKSLGIRTGSEQQFSSGIPLSRGHIDHFLFFNQFYIGVLILFDRIEFDDASERVASLLVHQNEIGTILRENTLSLK